ncbi:MAG: hypothetical protein RLZZ384_598, partial [Pseudomonadota bacterium]
HALCMRSTPLSQAGHALLPAAAVQSWQHDAGWLTKILADSINI